MPVFTLKGRTAKAPYHLLSAHLGFCSTRKRIQLTGAYPIGISIGHTPFSMPKKKSTTLDVIGF